MQSISAIGAEQFNHFAEQNCNRIALVRTIDMDFCSALSLYHSLACTVTDETTITAKSNTFLLEANDESASTNKLSIIGIDCAVKLSVKGTQVSVSRNQQIEERGNEPNPLNWLQEFCDRFRPCSNSYNLPVSCGLYGFLGYEMVRFIEPVLLGKDNPDLMGVPDSEWLLPNSLVVFDSNSGFVTAIVFCDPSVGENYEFGQQKLDDIEQQITVSHQLSTSDFLPTANPIDSDHVVTNFPAGPEGYKQSVDEIKQLIHKGEAFQVVLAQIYSTPITSSSWMLYRAIRKTSPSCYMYYMNFGDYAIAGSSPECLVKTTAYSSDLRTATVNPIAGTRRRGRTVQEDYELEIELQNDPKEIAEHLMLVDLGRNDLGRLAVPGSVQVTAFQFVKKYAQVMHLLSTVQAKIDGKIKPIELIKSTFPAGTLSGAPKVRAMQIIDEFEAVQRGPYAGGIGYIGFDGRLDLAICIRTAVIRHDLNMLYLGAGAGVVADSQPRLEQLECINKASSIVAPLRRVQERLN